MDGPVALPAGGRHEQGTRADIEAAAIRFGDGGGPTQNLADLVVTGTGALERSRRHLSQMPVFRPLRAIFVLAIVNNRR